MTADTYSARLGLLKQATGNNNNNWGDKFNSSFTDVLDDALFGIDTHAVTGGTLDLSGGTQPPAGPGTMIGSTQTFSGALTAAQVVIVPALQGKWNVFNTTSGAFSLTLKTPGGTPIEIPQGTFKQVICDGTNIYRTDRDRVGRLEYHAGAPSTVAGALVCNGASLLRSDYPYLFGVIGTTYGSADGLHFNVPNMQDTGRYLRSSTSTLTYGTYQSNQFPAHTHAVSGSVSGTTDNPGNHTHANFLTDGGHSHILANSRQIGNVGTGVGSPIVGIQLNNGQDNTVVTTTNTTGITLTNAAAGAHTHVVSGSFSVTSGSSGTGSETRPETLVAVAVIVF